jgi:hypothetical protein
MQFPLVAICDDGQGDLPSDEWRDLPAKAGFVAGETRVRVSPKARCTKVKEG